MKIGPYIGWVVLVMVFGSAILGMLIRRKLPESHFTLLEGTTGKPSQLAPGRQAGRWMRVDGEGRSVDAEKLASRLRFSPEFAHKVANEIAPGRKGENLVGQGFLGRRRLKRTLKLC